MPQKQPERDSVTTINDDGSHYIIHPADVSGRFTNWRKMCAWTMIALYVLLPWIPIGGHPAVFLDVINGHFHLFGLNLVTQDLWLLFFVITGVGFSLFYLTALFGRLWCGWACPQTIFLEHVFRAIERLTDGDAVERRKLDNAPFGPAKAAKRILKHTLFILCALIIAHIFISYFVSLPRLYDMMESSPLENGKVFLFVLTMAAILYGNFAWFREQFCIVLCPYGRFQSALIDEHTLIIGYDEKRGEPRGKASDASNGDCINCRRCVQVCPTGIDIRQGLQMECIGCANCIDACDKIMDNLNRPKGLIRYDSQAGLDGSRTKLIRPRTLLYSALLLIGAAVMSFSLTRIHPASLSVTRLPGAPYILNDQESTVRNNYYVSIINKRDVDQKFHVTVTAPQGVHFKQNGFTEPVLVPAEDEIRSPLILVMTQSEFRGAFQINVELSPAGGGRSITKHIRFLGPDY